MDEELIFGPPGCGKTYTLIDIVKEELGRGTPPDKIAFVSFSKKSIEEAKDRISEQTKLSLKDVPWFKTLHSTGYHWLGLNDSNMLTRADFTKLGEELGVIFDGNTARSNSDGVLLQSFNKGNQYLELIGRATMREVSLDQEYNDNGDYQLSYSFLKKVNKVYKEYKKEYDKRDFTDMIQDFVYQDTAPSIDVLIVDEAQDLTKLQWSMIDVLKKSAKRVWYAGDDDQAIHAWNGVDVKNFMNSCSNIRILDQSYRVPMSVHGIADKIVKRIDIRQKKEWNPTTREGLVDYHMNWYDVNIDEGSWTIMARTNKIVSKIETNLRDNGYLYERFGQVSFDNQYTQFIKMWEDLREDKPIALDMIKQFYGFVPKQGKNQVVKRGSAKTLDYLDPQSSLTYNELVANHGLVAAKSMRSEDVVNMSEDDQTYRAAILRRGEDLDKPRIKLSTIHQMKGGEDDNVILLSESCYPAVNAPNQDDEHRVFYTGVTRAKHNLHIVDSFGKYRYMI